MKRTIAAVLLAALAAAPGWTQAPPPPTGNPGPGNPALYEGGGDEAGHGVGRISAMLGEVSMRHGDAGELSAAALNAPLVATDRVATGANSRAEIQFDSVNMIRVAPSSEVRIGDLQYKRYLVQIAQGGTTFRVLRPNDAQVEISTPSVSVRPVGQGTYRVSVNPDGTSEITVRQGEAEVFSPRGTERLRAAQTMIARGDPSDPEFQINQAVPFDEWDRWNTQRDNELGRFTTSSRYVPSDVYGAEELDQNGRWVNDPTYGEVWVPTVAPDWAPYRVGRWVWVDYYGWTWLPGDSWGWAPYHWGRWYWGSYGWAWWPGAFGPRYYWSPALVGFFGWGGGVGIGVGFGFGFGHVGWVPLAPFEAFHPWYGRGFGGVNVVNNVNIVNNYRNARFVNGASGVTSMRTNEFGRGAVSTNTFVRASATDLRGAGSIQGRMPVSPARESMRMSERTVNAAGMPATNAAVRFAGRTSFSAPANAGRILNNGSASPAGAGGSAANNGGWSRMAPRGAGSSAGSTTAAGQPGSGPVNRGGYASNGGGWRPFNPSNPGATTPGSGNSGAARANITPRDENRGGYAGSTGAGYSAPPRQTAGGPGNAYPAPQTRGLAPQQPVRISPPIVSNRGASGGGAARPDVHSGFGGAHSGGGGGGNRGGGGGHRGR